jgi:hypothetical protein
MIGVMMQLSKRKPLRPKAKFDDSRFQAVPFFQSLLQNSSARKNRPLLEIDLLLLENTQNLLQPDARETDIKVNRKINKGEIMIEVA